MVLDFVPGFPSFPSPPRSRPVNVSFVLIPESFYFLCFLVPVFFVLVSFYVLCTFRFVGFLLFFRALVDLDFWIYRV